MDNICFMLLIELVPDRYVGLLKAFTRGQYTNYL